MAMEIDFQPYLRSLSEKYAQWRKFYTQTDAETRSRQQQEPQPWVSPFDFGLMVQTVPKGRSLEPDGLDTQGQETREKIERFPVLDGIRKCVAEHRQVLLVGRPGSGKSTTLARLLLEETRASLPNAVSSLETDSLANPLLGGARGGLVSSATDRPTPPSGHPSEEGMDGLVGLNCVPVLVELRFWQTSVVDLIRDFFKRHQLPLDRSQIEDLLFRGRLLLLLDGLNELPSEEARLEVAKFRKDSPQVLMIFTTRDLSLGGDFGLEKKLEMQPLSEAQMQMFVRSYLSEQAEVMLRQLKDRLREFAKTPLLLWMLCEVFKQSPQAELPSNLGEIFRTFTKTYELSSVRKYEVAVLKGDATPLSDRDLWSPALSHLAFVMMNGATPIDSRTTIDQWEAEQELQKLFCNEPNPSKTARNCLKDLLKYHLLKNKTDNVLEFIHQLIQEYYAAEALLRKFEQEQIGDFELEREYLNYLKWTEPVALMLALIQNEDLATHIIRQSLDIDLKLSAKLAGKVKPEIQASTVSIIYDLKVPKWLKVDLLMATQSREALCILKEMLQIEEVNIRKRIVWKTEDLHSDDMISMLQISLKDSDSSVRKLSVKKLSDLADNKLLPTLINVLKDPDLEVQGQAIWALKKFDTSEIVIPLLEILNEVEPKLGTQRRDLSVALSIDKSRRPYWDIIVSAEHALQNIDIEVLLSGLKEAMNSQDCKLRRRAIQIAKKRDDYRLEPLLFFASLDLNKDVHEEAANALKQLSDKKINQVFFEKRQRDAFNKRIDIYIECIRSEDPIHRGNALCELISVIDEKTATEWTIEALGDPHQYVRGHAIRILEDLLGKDALPYLLKTLSDDHFLVRSSATNALMKLYKSFALSDIEIPESAISKCICTIDEERDDDIRDTDAQTLVNLCDLQPRLLFRSDLEETFLKASRSPYNCLRSTSARALGKIGREKSSARLLEMIEDPDFLVSSTVSEVLGNITSNDRGKLLPELAKLISTSAGNFALHAIQGIQANCKYYNYNIIQTIESMQLKAVAELQRPENTQTNPNPVQSPVSIPTQITYDFRGASIANWAANQYGTQQTTQIQPYPSPPPETPQ
ncbi:MAG TPA: HEAT repeat domain-containing protein [Stenomitos sp.]